MATVSKPPSFRRSSDRKVTDPNQAIAIREDRRRQKEMEAFEAVGVSAAAHSVLVEPLDLSDSWERRVDFMEVEDAGNDYDRDGVVR